MRTASLKKLYELQAQKKLAGVFQIDNLVYHAAPGLSKSAFDNLDESPAYFQWRLNNPEEWTEALIFGSAYGTLLLEEHLFEDNFYITKTQPREPKPDGRGRMPLSEANLELAKAMRVEFLKREKAVKLISGLREISFFWTDPETGILCKSRPDIWFPKLGLVADLKTMRSTPTKEACGKQSLEYRYHVQAIMALEGIRQAVAQGGWAPEGYKDPDRMVFIFQSKKDNMPVATRPLGPVSIVAGEQEYRRGLELYARCATTNKWPDICGENIDDEEYELPTWYLNRNGDEQ